MSAASAGTRRLPRWALYCLIALAATRPLLLGYFSGDYDLVRRLAETPVVVGLVAFVVKILLDANERSQERAAVRHREERDEEQRRHEAERAALTQQLEHAFALGSSSHMANIAFDKHVAFCEAYAAELRATLVTLHEKGPTEEVRPHAVRLIQIRSAQALWLTPEIDAQLEKVERALLSMAAAEHRQKIDDRLVGEERQESIRHVFSTFYRLLGMKEPEGHAPPTAFDESIEVGYVVRWLGNVLGVSNLTALRLRILGKATANTAKASADN